MEGHVAGVEANDGVEMARSIAREIDDGLGGGFCSMGLGEVKGDKGNEEVKPTARGRTGACRLFHGV